MRVWTLLVVSTLLGACVPKSATVPLSSQVAAVAPAELDVLRVYPGSPKILVQVILPDGDPALFMVDTGADISVVSQEIADRLELPVQKGAGSVTGIQATARIDQSILPWVEVGGKRVENIHVAVNIPGLPDRFGFAPLAGILGNNVWSNFVLEIDYHNDRMFLHDPRTTTAAKGASPMVFDGGHIHAPIDFRTQKEPKVPNTIFLALDTGATDLIIQGRTGQPFENDYTEGLEPVFGLGASDDLPLAAFFTTTRRIPLKEVTLGGTTVPLRMDARWLFFDQTLPPSATIRGLAGYALFADKVAVFDYARGRFLLTKSNRPLESRNVHQLLLDEDIAKYGDDPTHYLDRARYQFGLGEFEEAEGLLGKVIENPDLTEQHPEARVLLARSSRAQGDLAVAADALAGLTAEDLVEEEEIVSAVNGLLLEDRVDDGRALAEAAVEARPEEDASWVALADVQFREGDLEAARMTLLKAAKLRKDPDAFMVRRARIAVEQGDLDGAIARFRRLVQLYPNEGKYLWFYAQLIGEQDYGTFRSDMVSAMERLHPGMRPLDFVAGSYHVIGDQLEAEENAKLGRERDCARIPFPADIANCKAWYSSMEGTKLEEAERQVRQALEDNESRSDFLDTLAMIQFARGEYQDAYANALHAARISPEDPYLLWQAERLRQRVESSSAP